MHIMVDVETLATTADACILTIGAQQFSPYTTQNFEELRYFYTRVEIDSQENRNVDENTISWWSKQPEASKEEAFSEENRVPLRTALEELSPLIWQSDFMWINDPIFEVNILGNAYNYYDMPLPWRYYRVRDTRTIYSVTPNLVRPPATHHALEDCRRQISMLQECFNFFNIKSME